MTLVTLIHQTEDIDPYYSGAMIAEKYILSYGFFRVQTGRSCAEGYNVYYYHLEKKSSEREAELRKELFAEGFKCHPEVGMELEEGADLGLLELVERGEIHLKYDIDDFPKHPLIMFARRKIEEGLTAFRIKWQY